MNPMSGSDQNRPNTFVTGEWTVEPSRNLLLRGEEETRVEPRVMDVLVYLAGHPGRVVSKDELVRFVWQDRCVTDDVLTVAISALRKALGDDARGPEYVETVPRRGYRWIARVSPVTTDPEMVFAPPVQGKKQPIVALRGRPVSRFAAVSLTLLLGSAAIWVALALTRHARNSG